MLDKQNAERIQLSYDTALVDTMYSCTERVSLSVYGVSV